MSLLQWVTALVLKYWVGGAVMITHLGHQHNVRHQCGDEADGDQQGHDAGTDVLSERRDARDQAAANRTQA